MLQDAGGSESRWSSYRYTGCTRGVKCYIIHGRVALVGAGLSRGIARPFFVSLATHTHTHTHTLWEPWSRPRRVENGFLYFSLFVFSAGRIVRGREEEGGAMGQCLVCAELVALEVRPAGCRRSVEHSRFGNSVHGMSRKSQISMCRQGPHLLLR